MIDLESDVRGPYKLQPLAIKLASFLAYLACIGFLVVVPVWIGAAVLAGLGTPATSRSGTYGPFVLLLGMLLIGAWLNDAWLRWLSGGRLQPAVRWLVFGIVCGVSASGSAVAIVFHTLPIIFACVLAFVPVSLLTYFVAVKAIQTFWGAA